MGSDLDGPVILVAAELFPFGQHEETEHEARGTARAAPDEKEAVVAQVFDEPTAEDRRKDDTAESKDLVGRDKLSVFRAQHQPGQQCTESALIHGNGRHEHQPRDGETGCRPGPDKACDKRRGAQGETNHTDPDGMKAVDEGADGKKHGDGNE